MNADLIDAVIGIDSRIGEPTPDWAWSDEFAVKRMNLGASLTILRDSAGEVIRYTIHHIGAPYKIPAALGERLQAELPLKACWVMGRVGAIDLKGGTLTLYQVKGLAEEAAAPREGKGE